MDRIGEVKTTGVRRENSCDGGYDCELVGPCPEGLETQCSICLLIPREPHLISCCGHNFCQSCITCVKTRCPLCSEAEFSVMHNKGLERALHDLEVRCTHSVDGCEWTGWLRLLEKHLGDSDTSCKYAEVKCTYGCGNRLRRISVDKHERDECPKRPYSCDYCRDFTATFEEVALKHWSECKCYPVSCPNNCSPYAVERRDLERHLSDDCPLTVVNCDFHYTGCDVKLPRKDMPAHVRDNFVHLTLLAVLNQRLTKENQDLTTQLLEKDKELRVATESMRAEIDELREEVAAQSHQCKACKQSMESLKRTIAKKQDKDAAASREEYDILMQEVDEHQRSLEELQTTIQNLLPRLGVVPVTIIMTQFKKHHKHRKEWYSNPFYTHPHGYNMCLKVDACGTNDGRGTHLSVFFCLMCGDFDDDLGWPFRGIVSFQLLNQEKDQKDFEAFVEFTNDMPGNAAERVIGIKRAQGWGWSKFISLDRLNGTENCQYLKNDCLRFRVTSVELK